MTAHQLAWHFLKGNALRDGREAPPDGEWLVFEGECELCRAGLHASRRLLDAVKYAPGNTLCRVEVDDVQAEADDKLVCKRRRIVWRLDARDVLRRFARQVALDVLDRWPSAPEAVRQYLETGDEALRPAAYDAAAAYAAAADAAADAAAYAADADAYAAADAAAYAADAAAADADADAAYAAAYAAADAAVEAAAYAADAAAADAAVEAAAYAAAYAAAKERCGRWLEAMVEEVAP